jgi:ketosteroid isomerase-like protein
MFAALMSVFMLTSACDHEVMTENDLPAAIRNFIDATNRGDSDAFVAAFTEDAYLNDWGREYHGHDGVRAWNETDNIGVRSHFELVSATAGATPASYVVTLTVSGDGFNGTGPMNFELRDERIARLRIG